MSDSSEEKPKIIIDSDWKEQVKAEKEQMSAEQAAGASAKDAPETASGDATAETAAESGDAFDAFDAMPPASFPMLVTSLATQAAAALGQMPDPIDGKTTTNVGLAKHVIDTLAVLQEKTKGNLSPEEDTMLESYLHQLRVAFLAAQK